VGNLVKKALSLSDMYSQCFRKHHDIPGCSILLLIHTAEEDTNKDDAAYNGNEYPVRGAESEHRLFLPSIVEKPDSGVSYMIHIVQTYF
jgi:hypothetical protein